MVTAKEKPKIVFKVDFDTVKAYLERGNRDVDTFVSTLRGWRYVIFGSDLLMFFVILFFSIWLWSVRHSTQVTSRVMILALIWLVNQFSYRYVMLDYTGLMKLLVNDTKSRQKNFTKSNSQNYLRQANFLILAQLASKEGYVPDLHLRIPTMDKKGVTKQLQRMRGKSNSVDGVSLLYKRNYVPWSFKVTNCDEQSEKYCKKLEKALDNLWMEMLCHEYTYIYSENFINRISIRIWGTRLIRKKVT